MATTTSKTSPLAARELRAWKGLLRTHSLLTKELDAELERAHGISLSSYEVLLHLANAEGGRLRMSELADSVVLSRSGLTRLVDRLEREQLIERCACTKDARGFYACLTDIGRARFAEAQHTHLGGVRRLFVERVDAAHLDVLAEVWERVAPPSAAGDGPCH